MNFHESFQESAGVSFSRNLAFDKWTRSVSSFVSMNKKKCSFVIQILVVGGPF